MKHLAIIDGYSFLFRAYHAVRPLTRSDGLHTNALYGFSQMLIRVMKDLQPDMCAVALDSPTNFRKEIYPKYKANRSEMDPEMVEQLPLFEPLINAFGIAALRVDGVEADDIIATLVKIHKHDLKITIVSSDKDLMQLLTVDNVSMLDTMKNKSFGKEQVFEKFGVYPDKIIEVQSLIGDASDNVPGVPSVGPKTAAQLITEFGTVDNLYANLGSVAREKLRTKLADNEDMARISKKLVTLKQDVELTVTKDELDFHPDISDAAGFLHGLEFNSLAQRLSNGHGNTAKAVAKPKTVTPETKSSDNNELKNSEQSLTDIAYETVDDSAKLAKWIQKLESAKLFAIDTETTGLDAMTADLVGISLSVTQGEACYIPLAHIGDMLGEVKQISKQEVLDALSPILKNKDIRKVGQNIKYDLHILRRCGLEINGVEDTMLMSFCLDGGKHSHGMDNLAQLYLNHKCMSFKDVCGTGKKQITFDYVPIDVATKYAAEDADITLRLYNIFKERLDLPANENVKKVYTDIELPLVPVLVNMEKRGVAVDRTVMEKLSMEFEKQLKHHEKKIHELADEEFNIASPKQLGEILFDKLELSVGKNTKRSTNQSVLEKLSDKGHEIAEEIIHYRQLSKLRSTYTEALIQQINSETKRVHTSYNQAGASTGRFSSSDPNMQNIPIRTENGRKIRQAFVPKDGHVLMGLDYSQIELRLLAHDANCEPLIEAFKAGADIHRHTASQIFNTTPEEVSGDQRSAAKAINFGIVYGMGAVALARQIGVKKDDAQAYIDAYFERYKGVREFMDGKKEFAQQHGYVETMFGRRINLPDIDSSHGGFRAGAERAAINAPLQGANADIIKMVMPRIEEALNDKGLKTKMLMQVHDELVFEVPKDEIEQAEALIRDLMEHAVELKLPLSVGSAYGDNWEAAH